MIDFRQRIQWQVRIQQLILYLMFFAFTICWRLPFQFDCKLTQFFYQQIMNTGNSSSVRIRQDEQLQAQSQSNTEVFDQQGGFNRNRKSGLAILVILFAAFWVYGWAGEITLILSTSTPVNWTSQSMYAALVALSAIFTIIGFGMLFTYFKHSPASSFFTSIFVVSFTIILSPIFSKFWFNVFLTDFTGTTISTTNPNRFFFKSFGGLNIYLDLFNLKVAFANCISQLVVFLGVFGRLSLPQIIINTFLYNFLWNLSHFLCSDLQTIGPDTRIFDDYLISNVYLFGASYALALSLILKISSSQRIFCHNNQTVIIALLGTFFVFMSFCTTTAFFPLKFTPGQAEYSRSYVWQEGFLSTFFAMSASIIFTLTFSILFRGNGANGGRLGIKEIIFGTFSGGIFYGSVAGTCINIGAAIASGLFSGLVTALYFCFLHKRMNSNGLFDSYGVVNTFLLSFLGTFVLAPIILISYYDRHWILTTFQVSNFDKVGLPIINSSIAGWVLAYVGISVGIGLVGGFVFGFLLYLLRNDSVKGSLNQEFFTLDYGLTPYNSQIFDEELLITTHFERVSKVLRLNKVQNRSVVNHLETIEINQQQNSLATSSKRSTEVVIDAAVLDSLFDAIDKDLKQINPNIIVTKAGLSEYNAPPTDQSPVNFKQFKALYFLAKSKKLERRLAGSSLAQATITLRERSIKGQQDKNASVASLFKADDGGVAYLNFLKSKYEGLSLQTTIKS